MAALARLVVNCLAIGSGNLPRNGEYANGANNNFKGLATLRGSGMADYRKALWWATAATLAGFTI